MSFSITPNGFVIMTPIAPRPDLRHDTARCSRLATPPCTRSRPWALQPPSSPSCGPSFNIPDVGCSRGSLIINHSPSTQPSPAKWRPPGSPATSFRPASTGVGGGIGSGTSSASWRSSSVPAPIVAAPLAARHQLGAGRGGRAAAAPPATLQALDLRVRTWPAHPPHHLHKELGHAILCIGPASSWWSMHQPRHPRLAPSRSPACPGGAAQPHSLMACLSKSGHSDPGHTPPPQAWAELAAPPSSAAPPS